MIRYEALLLTVPELTADEAKSVEDQISRLVASHKGSLISFERWGKYRLAYPVKKNDYGLYFLVRFETPESQPLVEEVKILLNVRLHDLIMRSLIARLEAHESLAYQRPTSLEETPAREVGSFFKDNHRSDRMSDQMNDEDGEKEYAHD